jgi:N utilization substance protein A
MSSPISQAIQQICDEKNIPVESVIETVEAALAVAYRKDFGEKNQNINVEFSAESGQSRIFDVKTVVEISAEEIAEQERIREDSRLAKIAAVEAMIANKSADHPIVEVEAKPEVVEETVAEVVPGEEEKLIFDPKTMIPLFEAIVVKPDAKLGDEIRTELFPPTAYGRMAAQTAKQVIIQRLREAERETVYQAYKGREGELINGTVQRVEGRLVFVDLGDAGAIMPPQERIEAEHYQPGLRLKFYLVGVNQTSKGPEITVSRAHPEVVRKLFSFEVPEIASGAVEIVAIAREAGSRTKIAVRSIEANIDPVGSCVGQRGTRVQTVISELGGEKIDIIEYADDPVKFIINSLAPAKILSVKTMEEEKIALAEVKEDQLSLAIGRGGQNVRLAARLTGWKIDIVKEGGDEAVPVPAEVVSTEEAVTTETPIVEAGTEAVVVTPTVETELPVAKTPTVEDTAPAEPTVVTDTSEESSEK